MSENTASSSAVRLAPEPLDDAVVLGVGEAELAVRRERAHAVATSSSTCATSEANSTPPSAEPVSGSTACSGWGIRPMTLRSRLHTAAMSRSEPFGFWPAA